MSLIEVQDLAVYYPLRAGFWNRIVDTVQAVDGISFQIESGESFGLVGESGSGKSTTGKTIVGLETATRGQILYQGQAVTQAKQRRQLNYNREVQMIFQDSLSSLNPQKRIGEIIAEPLRNFSQLSQEEEKLRVLQLLETVGLSATALYKYPHQFSGGQRQRIGIARAVATHPKLIIADEPVSALDLSVQAQVLNFMKKIQQELQISYLFISHDLGVVRHMCQKIGIMHRGRLVEVGTREDIYQHPQHIYTQRLLAAIPEINVAQRAAQQERRRKIERIYQEQQAQYYDPEGRAFDLQPLTSTHWVALPTTKIQQLGN
ncbi:ABC transporter ATP-binding protein [Lactobacillus sp. DCY120]|uniref:ABC transporter ATP-binding protein n=1 Tax=Bombilactobacillus apium TaxID=2675299 RepID=A0A850R2Q4_9LACO|nr:ATP-binding cassette domain-containing protein [Bombilactobacillus apium]NVY96630.1 ABC transporter ATP-binding protein [Bombilactobacillus apium]